MILAYFIHVWHPPLLLLTVSLLHFARLWINLEYNWQFIFGQSNLDPNSRKMAEIIVWYCIPITAKLWQLLRYARSIHPCIRCIRKCVTLFNESCTTVSFWVNHSFQTQIFLVLPLHRLMSHLSVASSINFGFEAKWEWNLFLWKAPNDSFFLQYHNKSISSLT